MASSKKKSSGKKRGTRRSSKNKGNVVSVDFSDVDDRSILKEEGDFVLTVEKAEIKNSDQSGADYVNFTLITEDDKVVYHTCSLQPQALWNLRNTLEALGMEVPQSAMDIDLDDLEGASLGANIELETYQGRKKPVIVDMFPADEASEEEGGEEGEEDETRSKKKTGKKAGKKKGGKKKGGKKKKEIEVGSEVTFEDEGEEYEGEVTEIEEDVYTVTDSDGDEWELELEDLTLVE